MQIQHISYPTVAITFLHHTLLLLKLTHLSLEISGMAASVSYYRLINQQQEAHLK